MVYEVVPETIRKTNSRIYEYQKRKGLNRRAQRMIDNLLKKHAPTVQKIAKTHRELKKGNLKYSDVLGGLRSAGIDVPNVPIPGNIDIGFEKGSPFVKWDTAVSLGTPQTLPAIKTLY